MPEAFNVATADQLQHPVLSDTFQYWDGLRSGAAMPAYAAIDPVDMPRTILRHLVMADVEGDPPDFRFRLMGSSVDKGNGFSGTNKLLTEHHGVFSDLLLEEYRTVVRLPAPRYSSGTFVRGDELFQKVERVIMPVTHDGTNADAVFGAIVFHRLPDKPPTNRSAAR